MRINKVTARKILNSLGNWTLEVTIESPKNKATASVPQGESTGQYEAKPVSIDVALENLKKIHKDLVGEDFYSIQEFDSTLIALDGTATKENLGANLVLALSIAFTKLLAYEKNKEIYRFLSDIINKQPTLPKFMLLIFEGGKHGSPKLTIQEFMLIIDDIEKAREAISKYKNYLTEKNLFTGYGLEGAFTSSTFNDYDVLELLTKTTPEYKIALDVAESSRVGEPLNFEEMIQKFNIGSIEDPKDEKDYTSWKDFYKTWKNKLMIVADDLTTTNKTLIENAQKEKLANAIIIKPNQVGTVSETLMAIEQARKENWKIIVSHRGGDTNDSFIADLAIGVSADYVKFGGLQRGERIAKYNRFLEIKNKLSLDNVVASIL